MRGARVLCARAIFLSQQKLPKRVVAQTSHTTLATLALEEMGTRGHLMKCSASHLGGSPTRRPMYFPRGGAEIARSGRRG
jgi:hypothetical protein